MPTAWTIDCVDDNQERYTISVTASTADIAKVKAINGGHSVLHFDPKTVRVGSDSGAVAMAFAGFLMPLVGVVFACVLMARNKSGVGSVIAASLGGLLVWSMILAACAH